MTNNSNTREITLDQLKPGMLIRWTDQGVDHQTLVGTVPSSDSFTPVGYSNTHMYPRSSTGRFTLLNPSEFPRFTLTPGSLGVGVTTTGETIWGYVFRGESGCAPYVRTISSRGQLQNRRYARELQSWTQLYPYPEEPVSSWDRWEDVPEMTPVVASKGALKHLAYRKNREGRTESYDGSRWTYSRTSPHGGPHQGYGPFTRTEVDPTTGNPLP